MNFIFVLSIFTGVLMFAGFVLYFFSVIKNKETRPNTASWVLWAFGDVITCATYVGATEEWREFLSSCVSATTCVILVVVFVFLGKFRRIDKWDKIIVAVDISVIILWLIFQSALFANLLIQISAIITFIPIIRSTAKNPRYEKPHAWFMWTTAYALTAVVVILLNSGHWAEVIYPLNYALLHVIVGILALRK